MTTPPRPIPHPDPAVLAERRRQAADIADQAVALAMDLAADFGKTMEIRPDFWGRPFLDYAPGSGWNGEEPAALLWAKLTASQSLRAQRGLDNLEAAPPE